VDNPFAGAQGYVNPDWAAQAAAEPGGTRVSNQPTGIWMDRVAAIGDPNGDTGGNGTSLDKHLRNAVAQDASNGNTPVYAQFVIYDLPNRDCSALASNGEFRISQNGLALYKSNYIDVIRGILAKPAYNNIRKILIIEIDSLPNLVTNVNMGIPDCDEANSSGAYVQGVQYALSQFSTVPNTYNYIDAAHHGWIGWDDNFNRSAQLFSSTANGAVGGRSTVTGFITNTANYSALSEPNFTIGTTVNGQSVRNSSWVDFNSYIDELTFAQAFRTALIQQGFSSSIGMIIDTSRNGWGGCVQTPCQPLQGATRPTAPSTSTDVNTFVNQSRVDKRIHAGNWCNQAGAGRGERPRANPGPAGIDAYVCIKPPGESDGASCLIQNDEGKKFVPMCDPSQNPNNPRNKNNLDGALPNAPLSGKWFSAQFRQLMANAFPAL
jgi:cellulose 1,4-beta-cellobiosidase